MTAAKPSRPLAVTGELPVTISPPQQQRSRASFERVLEAGTALLEEKGYEGFTLAEVSRRAGVSIGSIYARVKSKDDLFLVIQDRYMTGSETDSAFADGERWAGLSARELVDAIVDELSRVFHRDVPLLRVFMHRGIVDAAVAARSSQSVSWFSDQVEALLLTRRKEIGHADPELAVDVAFRMVWGTMARQVMYWPTFESRRELAWDTLVGELGKACAAYLFARPGKRAN
ncbi:MAG TPA: TetR/AcrR family transcriptional regulator [Gaiellaceae bacterium]|jgi:AcrR family transcriptional regulator